MRKVTEVLDVLQGLINTPLGGDKIMYLLKYKEDEEFKKVLYWLLSPRVVLGLKKIQPIGIEGDGNVDFISLASVIHKLNRANINDEHRRYVAKFISMFPIAYQELLIGLFTKTLKVGVTAKNVNKVYSGLVEEFKCMLADTVDTTEYPAYVETKWDGVRCLVEVHDNDCTMYTRHGNIIHIPTFHSSFIALAKGSSLVFDCELVTETRTDASGKINSIMKTGYTPEKAEGLIARVFDCVPKHNFDKGLTVNTRLDARLLYLDNLFINNTSPRLTFAYGVVVHNEEQMSDKVNELINIGEEGAIVKPLSSPYVFKRSQYWGKFKAVNSTTLQVVDVTTGTGARKGQIGALVCKSSCGALTVNVGGGLTKDDLETLNSSIVGSFVEVLFNVVIDSEDQNGYSLFLPRLKSNDWLRIDKTEADSLDKILKEHIGKPQIRQHYDT